MEIVTFSPEAESDRDLNASLSLDIIAIHGLNGNQLNTWTEPKSKKLWLRDFLPKDLQASRVMAFGYNATAAFDNSVAGIRDHARGLLGALLEKRDKSFEAKRPLIFIGHSLGGLVIKQALVIAEQEIPYKQIYNSTLGVIFFGTPHQGSSIANYATTITHNLLILTNKPNAELLESLRTGSPVLKQLNDDWTTHHERRPYEIVSFYETRTMKGLRGLIVEKTSALLTPPSEVPTYEEQIPVGATHTDMCRFATPKDKTYKAVVQKIKRIQQGCEVKATHEFYVVPHSASLHFTGRNDIREQLNDSFLSYRTSKSQQRFVLYGLGGSGKTQVSLKFAEDNRESFWGIFWIDASSEETAKEGFANLARACKQEESVESVKAWLSRKKHWLLILDNVDNPDLDVSKFFPSQERGAILITTRNPDLRSYGTGTGNAGSHCVDKLCLEDAVALLLKTAAIKDLQDLQGENVRKVAERIVNDLGGLALAIIQAGAVIRQGICSLDEFCDLYSKQKREVLESGRSISSIESYQYSVFTTWEISIEKIEEISDEHARLGLELLRMFSFMHFDGIRKDIFKSAIENSLSATDVPGFKGSLLARLMPEKWDGLLWGKAMKLLLAFSLITTSHSGLISMHPLVHLWSRERMSVSERGDTWKTTMATLSMSVTDFAADERKRLLLLPHIDSLLEHNSGQCVASVPGDLGGECRAVLKFHMAYLDGGQFQKALSIAQADLKSKESILNPRDNRCLYLRFLVGLDLACLQRFRESIETLESLMKELPESTHYFLVLQIVSSLGGSYNCLKEYRTSLNLCKEVMERFGDCFKDQCLDVLSIYLVMGEALSGLERPKEALTWSTKAVLGFQKHYGMAHSRTSAAMEYLARNYQALNDIEKACDWQEKSVNLIRDILGTNHPSTILQEEQLIDYVDRRRRTPLSRKKILGRRKACLDQLSKQVGDKHFRTLDCQARLAQDYFFCGLLKKAMLMQEICVEAMIQEYGQDDGRTAEVIAQLATTKRWIKIRKIVYWWVPNGLLK